jgi:hypothetical protein
MWLEGMTEAPSTKGGAAFIVIEQETGKNGPKPYRLHFGRNDSNPLYLQLDNESLTLASEHATGDGAESIMSNFLYTFNYRTKALSLRPMKLETYTYVKTQGGWVDGEGYVTPTHAKSLTSGWKPQGNLRDADYMDAEDEYYAGLADSYSKQTNIMTSKDEEDELEKAADDYLAEMMDRYGSMDDVEYRLQSDMRRAKQAVTQLGEIVRTGKVKSRVLKKYHKYLRFFKVCTRAICMYTLIVDDEAQEIKTAEFITDILSGVGGSVDET